MSQQPPKREPDWTKAEDLLIRAFAATGEELSRPRARAILDEYTQRIEQNLRGTGTGGTPVGLVGGPARSCEEGRTKRCIWDHKILY